VHLALCACSLVQHEERLIPGRFTPLRLPRAQFAAAQPLGEGSLLSSKAEPALAAHPARAAHPAEVLDAHAYVSAESFTSAAALRETKRSLATSMLAGATGLALFGSYVTLAGQDAQSRRAAPRMQIEAADPGPQPEGVLARLREAAGAVYRFSRPHTIRGTLLACFTGVGRALLEQPEYLGLLQTSLLPRAMLGVLALLLGNLFIVGINQIYDVEIDTVNKPFLPIAAGRISRSAAWWIVVAAGASGLALVKALFNPLIFGLYAFGTLIGGLYSVPPIQLKRFPLAAGMTIAICRGFLLNFGVYYATREALGLGFLWSAPVAFLARFMTVYASVIAVTKDLGDIEGDRKGGIETFAMRYGPKVVANGASLTLFVNYVAAIATGLLAPPGTFRTAAMVGGHGLAAAWLARSALRLQAESAASIKEYYKQIWNLFYFEYLLYVFI